MASTSKKKSKIKVAKCGHYMCRNSESLKLPVIETLENKEKLLQKVEIDKGKIKEKWKLTRM